LCGRGFQKIQGLGGGLALLASPGLVVAGSYLEIEKKCLVVHVMHPQGAHVVVDEAYMHPCATAHEMAVVLLSPTLIGIPLTGSTCTGHWTLKASHATTRSTALISGACAGRRWRPRGSAPTTATRTSSKPWRSGMARRATLVYLVSLGPHSISPPPPHTHSRSLRRGERCRPLFCPSSGLPVISSGSGLY
jgi:hypothetical protein